MSVEERELPVRAVLWAERGVWVGVGILLAGFSVLNFFYGGPPDKNSILIFGSIAVMAVFILRPRRQLLIATGVYLASVGAIAMISFWSPLAANIVWIVCVVSFAGALIANGLYRGSYVVLDLKGIRFVDFWHLGSRLAWSDVIEIHARHGLAPPKLSIAGGSTLTLQQNYGPDRDEMLKLMRRFHERSLAEAKL